MYARQLELEDEQKLNNSAPNNNETGDFTIIAGDVGKIFDNIGAGGDIVGTFDSGLSAGFTVYFVRLETGHAFTIRAPAGEQIRKLDGTLLDEGLGIVIGAGQSVTLKKDNADNWFMLMATSTPNYEVGEYSSLSVLFPGTTVATGVWVTSELGEEWSDPFSFTCWLKLETHGDGEYWIWHAGDVGTNATAFAIAFIVELSVPYIDVHITSDGNLGGLNRKHYRIDITSVIADWFMFGFVIGAGELKLYINGAEDADPTKLTDGDVVSTHLSDPMQMTAGGRYNSVGDPYDMFLGPDDYIDEPALWSAELDGVSMDEVYNAGKPCDLTTLLYTTISRWRFGEDDVFPTLSDLDETDTDLTITGTGDEDMIQSDVP